MSDNEEQRRVKARHDVTQFYQRKKVVSRRELPRADITIEENPSPNREVERSKDEDVEDETYMPSRRARPHGKGLASASGSGAAREEEIEEEEDGNDGADSDDSEEGETFAVDEINPSSYVHMGTPILWQPQNLDCRAKISYKGKTNLVREKRKENPRLVEKEPGIDYRFHTAFQLDFYESVIIPQNKHVAISQWIDWNYMEGMNDRIFNEVVTACRANHLRELMSFQKNWNNEIIDQFFATLSVEEKGTQEGSIG
jgi:hypothetical protein